MITENGIVTDANASLAWIKTTRSSACESCATKKGCATAQNQKEMIVTVKNSLHVEKGDHVVIGLETKPMMYLAFLLYVFPILFLIAGAVIGDSLAPAFNINPSLLSIALGVFFFGMSFYFIRKKNNTLASEDAYKPFLVRKRPDIIPVRCSLP